MHPESNIQRVRHRTSSALLKGLAASLVFSSQHPSFATQKGAANDVVQSLADIKSSAQFIETHCTRYYRLPSAPDVCYIEVVTQTNQA